MIAAYSNIVVHLWFWTIWKLKIIIITTTTTKVGCTVVWWLAPLPHSEKVPGLILTWGLSVWSLHVLPVYAWVLSGYSGFLPPSKNMHVRLIGDSKVVLRSECVWLLVLCGPVIDWWPVQGVPCLLPDDRWDRLQPPRDPTDGLSGYRKWMDNKIQMFFFASFGSRLTIVLCLLYNQLWHSALAF